MLIEQIIEFELRWPGPCTVPLLREGGGTAGRPCPSTRLLVPPISVYTEYVFETLRTIRQQAVMEKGIIAFKHNSR